MRKPFELTIEIPGLPDTQVGAGKSNWRARQAEAKRWYKRVAAVCYGATPPEPLKRARVTYERHSASQPDFGNTVASMKHVEDGLVRCGILEDDKPDNYEGGAPAYRWVKAKRGEGFVRVRIVETDLGPSKGVGRWVMRRE